MLASVVSQSLDQRPTRNQRVDALTSTVLSVVTHSPVHEHLVKCTVRETRQYRHKVDLLKSVVDLVYSPDVQHAV